MDVICERCGTEYEFDATLVSESGTSVKCTSCGHVFKVFRRTDGSVSTALRPWTVRLPSGEMESIDTLRDLQRRITEGTLPPDAEISRSGESWKRLDSIVELETFFAAARAAKASGVPLKTLPPAALHKKTSSPPRAPLPTRASNRPGSPLLVSERPQSGSKIPTLPPPALDVSMRPPAVQPATPKSVPPIGETDATIRVDAITPETMADLREGKRTQPGTLAWDQPKPPDAPTAPLSVPPAQTGGTVTWDSPAPPKHETHAEAQPAAQSKPSVRPPVLRADEDDLAGVRRPQRGMPVIYIVLGILLGVGVTVAVMMGMRDDHAEQPVVGSGAAQPTSPAAQQPAAAQADPLAALPTHTPDASTTVTQEATTTTPTAALAAADAATSVPTAVVAPPTTPTPSAAGTTAPTSTSTAATPRPANANAASGGEQAVGGRDFEYYVDRGRTLIEAGDTRGARTNFETALRMRPGDPDALVGLGWVAANTERYQEAIDHFRGAVAHGSTEAYVGLGQMYRSLGRNDDAIEAYRTYLQRAPSGSYARVARRWLDQLTESSPSNSAPSPTPAPAPSPVDPAESQTQ